MISLELFSGSGIVSKVLRVNDFITFSIDNNPSFHPTLCMDVMDLNPSMFPHHIDFIWASIPCTHFTRQCKPYHWQKTIIKYRRYNYEPLTEEASQSMRLVYKTLQIIEHLKPKLYIIENPVGRMRHIDEIRQIIPYRYSVNYKDWGFNYSKETDLFTNQLFCFDSKKVTIPGKGCNSLHGGYNRAVVPAELVQFIIDHAVF